MLKTKSIFVAVLLFIAACVLCYAHDNYAKANSDILSKINYYQEQYFKIIKRNDVLLQINSGDEFDNDLNDLKNLHDKVISEIKPDCEFLQKYEEIKEQYSKNTGETTVEMNEFVQNYYNAVDKLLNDTYKAVKVKIPQKEFDKLITSEINWLKEVKNYRIIYEQQGFGTIGGLVYLNYQINMKEFRTLLLMLYF